MRNGSALGKSLGPILAVVMILVLLSSATYFQGVPVGAQLSANIVAPLVKGSVDIQKPGQEAFWNQVAPLQIPITASDDYGGFVKSVSVKIANNGTHVLFWAKWSDPTQNNRSISGAPSDPKYPELFFANAPYYRSDRFAVWWSLDQLPGPPPCMQPSALGKGGAASIGGRGNVWQWIASSTDSGGFTFATSKGGAGTPLAGKLLNLTHSYARNQLLNTTGFFTLGFDSSNINSTVGYAENNIPHDVLLVWAKGVYDNTNHTWTLVEARPLTTTLKQNIQQFALGQTYYFAIAAFDGGPHPIPAAVPHPAGWTQMADNGMTKSISSWYTMALGPASSATSVSQSTVITSAAPGGITFETAAVISFAMLLVGFVAGMAVIAWYAAPKKSKGAPSDF